VPSIHPASKAILLNKGVLAINDDPLGRMPFRYSIDSLTGIELWRAHEKHEERRRFLGCLLAQSDHLSRQA
jgi:hypothetical protein